MTACGVNRRLRSRRPCDRISTGGKSAVDGGVPALLPCASDRQPQGEAVTLPLGEGQAQYATDATETESGRRSGRHVSRDIMLKVVRRDDYRCQGCGKGLKDDD
jgi:hypothetical protein